MYEYRIKFLALYKNIAFDVKSPIKESIEEFLEDLFIIFAKESTDGRKVVECYQRNTVELRKQIDLFNEKYKSLMPALNAVPSFFRKLKEDEHFFFLPGNAAEAVDSFKLSNMLRAAEEGKEFEVVESQMTELFGELRKLYQIKVYGDDRITIGEQDKSKRVCRFCQKGIPDVSFASKAHAISEALGNKTIVLLEECDSCNSHFSKTIEPDLVECLSLFRTVYDIKGKGGSKAFTGHNFKLKKEEELTLSVYNEDDRPEEFKLPYIVKLEVEAVTLQNIYKCFCKFFLSVIDSEYLQDFDKTIEWINGTREINKLPKIAEMISYHAFTTQPKIITYIRKSNDDQVPFAVGEFQFTCKIFVFIVPLARKDNREFIDQNNYDKFWQTFKHYNKTVGWKFLDYSNSQAKPLTISLNFNLKEKRDSDSAITPPA